MFRGILERWHAANAAAKRIYIAAKLNEAEEQLANSDKKGFESALTALTWGARPRDVLDIIVPHLYWLEAEIEVEN